MSVVIYDTQKLKERYQKHLESRGKVTREGPAADVLPEITTDDEPIVLYYILSNNIRKASKENVLEWLCKIKMYDVNVDNAFDLLSTLGGGAVSNDTLELNINTFRRFSAKAAMVLTGLKPCLERHI